MIPPRYKTLPTALLSLRKIHYDNKSSGTLLCPDKYPLWPRQSRERYRRGLTTIHRLLVPFLWCPSSSEREKPHGVVHLLRMITDRYEDINHIEIETLGLERERYWSLIRLGRHPLIREYFKGLDYLFSLPLVDV